MFREKCSHCEKKVSKKYEFCPHCGGNLKEDSGDSGFLGKEDFSDMGIKLPFGFKTLMKPLMKELGKQMRELDKELKKEHGEDKPQMMKNFSITIGAPGQKPIKLTGTNPQMNFQPKIVRGGLPKIDESKLEKIKNLPRKEPKTNVRRLADRVIYELDVPGVVSVKDINLSQLEGGLEVKAIADKIVFSKMINVKLPLVRCSLQAEKLVLEMGLK